VWLRLCIWLLSAVRKDYVIAGWILRKRTTVPSDETIVALFPGRFEQAYDESSTDGRFMILKLRNNQEIEEISKNRRLTDIIV